MDRPKTAPLRGSPSGFRDHPPFDKERYFHPLSIDRYADRGISVRSQASQAPTAPTGRPPPRDSFKLEHDWSMVVRGMQPNGVAWIGLMERSPEMIPSDLAEANPLQGRRFAHLHLRDIGAAGIYMRRDREPNENGFYPVRVYGQQTPSPTEEPRPQGSAELIPERTTVLAFGGREVHVEFGADRCTGAAAADPQAEYVAARPEVQPESETIEVRVHVHVDERTHPNGQWVDESEVVFKVQDTASPEGFVTITLPMRLKKRALYPCVGLSRGVAVALDDGPRPQPEIPCSAEHLEHHFDLAHRQRWRDVQQLELHRRKGNVPKIDADRSIRLARHTLQPSIVGYAFRESSRRRTVTGHLQRLGALPPMAGLPAKGEDVQPQQHAFIPVDKDHMHRWMPFGYIPHLGYEYVNGGRVKHNTLSAEASPAFGIFGRARSVGALKHAQNFEGYLEN